jgi:endoglucanase
MTRRIRILFRLLSASLALMLAGSLWMPASRKVSAAASLEMVMNRTNSWEENGRTSAQYSISLENKGTAKISGWTITIPVPEGTEMGSGGGWNGVFAIKDSVLTITPADYNKEIAAGAKISDIGFIVSMKEDADLAGSATAGATSGETSDTGKASEPPATQAQSTAETTGVVIGPDVVDVSAAPGGDDWLHTDGSKILDANGTEVWLTGLNWFGYNTGTNIFDGCWACNMREALASIADRGFNLLRIPISAELVLSWKNGNFPEANYNRAENPELEGLTSLQIFDLAIRTCKENGIKVMLDIHSAETDSMGHMKNLWYTDKVSTEDYLNALAFLADRYKSDDTVIAFDLKNEPHGKPNEAKAIWNNSDDANNWKAVAEKAGNTVLDINPNVLIMIEGIEIYPKDIAANGDFSSTDSGDYYFNWWGGNLRGVKDYPIDFGSESRNAQIVYSPHDYGPAVFKQPWFESGFTYESLQKDCWNDNWLFIEKENIAPLLIGEWGGFMTEPNLSWMTCMRSLIAEYHLNHTFWCFNANSGDTGGMVKDDFKTWDEEKYKFVKEVLWQENGKFVGLDHVIPLGSSGIALSVLSGDVSVTPQTTVTATPGVSPEASITPGTVASSASGLGLPDVTGAAMTSSGISGSNGGNNWILWTAAGAFVILVSVSAVLGHLAGKKRNADKDNTDKGNDDTNAQ